MHHDTNYIRYLAVCKSGILTTTVKMGIVPIDAQKILLSWGSLRPNNYFKVSSKMVEQVRF